MESKTRTQQFDSVPEWVDCDFTLICKGDSMTGARICDGDTVCVKAQETVESGQIAAVSVDEELRLARVYYIDNGLVLQPQNSEYPPLVFLGDKMAHVNILGLATHFISAIQ